MSASSKTMFAPLPPSSSWRRFRLEALPSTRRRPTAVDPVNDSLRTRGCVAMAQPAVSPYPGTILTTPSGTPASCKQLGDTECAERRQLARLHHHGVAGGEGRTELPTREHQRKVPGNDLADDADWFAQEVIQKTSFDRDHRSLVLVCHAAEIAEGGGSARDVKASRVADRVPRVDRLQVRQRRRFGFDSIGDAEQDPAAL